MAPLDDIAAALDNHQVTDDEGQIVGDETPQEESAPQEQTPGEEAATAEKSADTKESSPEETKESENEPELVETAADETGKRYVPESRFKEVYSKWKAAERKATPKEAPKVIEPNQVPPQQSKPLDKADALEIELLRSTIPQFNPESDQYDRDIDEMGFDIYQAAKGQMTRLEAGRKALERAKKITSKVADIKSEARTVKAQQSDQGITSRVLTREGTTPDVEKMTLEEKEEWLKANGYW
jgi:hypothetical protein